MTKFLFIYHGGGMPDTPEEGAKVMQAWEDWLDDISDSIIDSGHPVGQSSTVMADDSVVDDGGANPATGYGLFEAASLDDALDLARNCPILASGGSVEVAETFDP